PMLLSENSELYRSLCHEIRQSSTEAVSFATDAGWFQVAGIESVLFGPGDMEQAHRANESIPIDQLHRAEPILERLTQRFCRAAY
ncbi:MAG: M20/M25/M40 family metallo-hydrolase, partial [Gemmatimonadales bacterium]